MKLLNYISVGAENAITAAELSVLTGLTPRQVTRLIEVYRQTGEPICASCAEPLGFYIAADASELNRYLTSLKGRIRNIITTYRTLSAKMDKMSAQERISDFFEEGGEFDE